jgi:hypothetical protein
MSQRLKNFSGAKLMQIGVAIGGCTRVSSMLAQPSRAREVSQEGERIQREA